MELSIEFYFSPCFYFKNKKEQLFSNLEYFCIKKYFLINLLAVVCPFPNVTDNLVLLPNQTEYRFGDRTKFDCVEDFELSSQLAAIRNCVVDESHVGRGKWTGETPFCKGNFK